MSLIIQDDLGSIANVNSYVDIAYADDYFLSILEDDWINATDQDKEIALIQAFNYLDNAYVFYGSAITIESKFPRNDLVVDGLTIEGIPTAIKKAQCELALAYIKQGSLDTNIDYATGDTRTIIEESKDIAGAIKKTFKYETDGIGPKDYRYYQRADKYLNGYVSSLGNSATDGNDVSGGSVDIVRGL
ncbi:hypothetical protein LO80_03250 [Candidatus Francisella endociliophora]|uniref:Putative DnaT-like domain-containing protein n=1 Tax=Candidatus Francisella endociliophora TaxID=653937 RepID=A0A097ENE5_9GAMM|nr:DnaT-like ssDNA-binding protein [Francisella sp. FSC1006]AIT09084.1 hypothetical protein LO80_03250 [Francisella sp. FSC1006]